MVVENGAPTGIITETDVVVLVARDDWDPIGNVHVSEIMSTPLITVESSERLETAATTMQTSEIKKLPVIDSDELVGIVTTTDIAHYFPKYHPQAEDWIE